MAKSTPSKIPAVGTPKSAGKKSKAAATGATPKAAVPAAPKPVETIASRVAVPQAEKAIAALVAHHAKAQAKREETELVSRDEYVLLVVGLKTMTAEMRVKPVRVPIAHPLYDPRTTPICLISKDPQREYKDLLEAKKVKFVSRVVGVEKLKGKFKQFEARRALLAENEVFLADKRVVRLLPSLLGRDALGKKQPIPVDLTVNDLKAELERAVSSTYLQHTKGTCMTIKISSASHSASQILANLSSALPSIIPAIRGQWTNVQSLHLKTTSSASLPLWTCSPEERFVLPEGAAPKRKAEGEGEAGVSKKAAKKAKKAEKAAEKAVPPTPARSDAPPPSDDLPVQPTPIRPSSAKKDKAAVRKAAAAQGFAPVEEDAVDAPAPNADGALTTAAPVKKSKTSKKAARAAAGSSPAEAPPAEEETTSLAAAPAAASDELEGDEEETVVLGAAAAGGKKKAAKSVAEKKKDVKEGRKLRSSSAVEKVGKKAAVGTGRAKKGKKAE